MCGNNVVDGVYKCYNDGKCYFELDIVNVVGNGEKCFICCIIFCEVVDVIGGECCKCYNDNK